MRRSARYNPFRELVKARLREFLREPEVIFWVYGFPVLLAIGLGIAFRSTAPPDVHVAIVNRGTARATEFREALTSSSGFVAEVLDEERALEKLSSGHVDLVVVPTRDGDEVANEYVFDPTRAESRTARLLVDDTLQRADGRRDAVAVTDREVSKPGSRYIDFLFPGLMGMNLVGGGIYGVGFVIVDMRVRKLLKRFMATPMRKRDFFAAILTSRICFMIPEMLFLFGVATLGFGVPFRGDVLSLLVVLVAGAFCFAGIGLLIATRAAKLETASGLINFVILPMWLLSGIFFSTERFPDVVQPLIQALPLTAANDALRAVILDGQAFWAQADELAILLAWTAVSFLVSLRLFRWT